MQQSAFTPEEDVSKIKPNPQPNTLSHSARMNLDLDPSVGMALRETTKGSYHINVPRTECDGMANASRTTATDGIQNQSASTLDFTVMENAAESEKGIFSVYYAWDKEMDNSRQQSSHQETNLKITVSR